MSQLPAIDGLEFAAAGGRLAGRVPFGVFPRLCESLSSSEGTVAYEIEGCRDAHGRCFLKLHVAATLGLLCQRCLGAMQHPVESTWELLLVRSQRELDEEPHDPDALDRVLASREMDLVPLLEDELLLSIPYAPRHEVCSGPVSEGTPGTGSPFTVLQQLMQARSASRRRS